jgi:hypothetical protein
MIEVWSTLTYLLIDDAVMYGIRHVAPDYDPAKRYRVRR